MRYQGGSSRSCADESCLAATDRVAAQAGITGITGSGRFAARPSGTEDLYKIYAESFRGADHLRCILEEAQTIVSDAWAAVPERDQGHAPSLLPREIVREPKEECGTKGNAH